MIKSENHYNIRESCDRAICDLLNNNRLLLATVMIYICDHYQNCQMLYHHRTGTVLVYISQYFEFEIQGKFVCIKGFRYGNLPLSIKFDAYDVKLLDDITKSIDHAQSGL